MTYAYVHDVAASWVRYRAVTAELVEPAPLGLILHLAGPTDEGVRSIDVWESEEAGTRFRLDHLGPVIAGFRRAACRSEVLRHLHVQDVVIGRSDQAHLFTHHDKEIR